MNWQKEWYTTVVEITCNVYVPVASYFIPFYKPLWEYQNKERSPKLECDSNSPLFLSAFYEVAAYTAHVFQWANAIVSTNREIFVKNQCQFMSWKSTKVITGFINNMFNKNYPGFFSFDWFRLFYKNLNILRSVNITGLQRSGNLTYHTDKLLFLITRYLLHIYNN